MKKIVVFMLIILLIFGVVTTVAAEEPVTNTDVENPYSTINLVKQLRENPLVEDIWVPVLPNKYHLEGFEVTPNGSYAFYYGKFSEAIPAWRISIINSRGIIQPSDQISPYQLYLANHGYTTLPVNETIVQQVVGQERYRFYPSEKVTHTYWYEGFYQMGNYGEYKATTIRWDASFHRESSIADASFPLDVYESILALRPNMVASVLLGSFTNREQREGSTSIMEALQKNVPVSFVTSGDVDGNYTVNAKDALAILKHGVKKQMLTDELALLLADCDKNDTVDAKDALLTLRKAVFK